MQLSAYLAAERMKPADLAKKAGVSRQLVHKWLQGTQKPGADMIPLLVKATDGMVTAADLRPDFARAFGLGLPTPAPSEALA